MDMAKSEGASALQPIDSPFVQDTRANEQIEEPGKRPAARPAHMFPWDQDMHGIPSTV